jgi:NADH-quinone oxidoreductase subunit E
VGHDQTTADGKITLEHAECLAACDYAPVVTVNYDFAIDQATPEATVGLVEQLRNGERPMPSRGARICSLKEMQVQLAGFADDRDGAVADGPAGAPTLRGVSLAQEHGIAVADFNIDTPITTTKPARDESAKAVKDPSPGRATDTHADGKVVSVAKKAAGAVRAAAATVVEKAEHVVEHRRTTGGQPAGESGGDVKDPEVRAAEQRNPDASTPAPDANRSGQPNSGDAPANPAEVAGTEGSVPAGDGKPAGDSERGESIVSESNAEQQRKGTTDDNPGWQNAQRGTEEKK